MEFGKLADWQKSEDQRLLLVDETNHRILVQDPDGHIVAHGSKGDAAGEFHYPRGILAMGSSVASWAKDQVNFSVRVPSPLPIHG